ncbi:MAG: PLP-dependent transferase [Sphingomonadaceae bacterium]
MGETIARLATLQNATGPALGPFHSWLLLCGMKTLAVRLEMSSRTPSGSPGVSASTPWSIGCTTPPLPASLSRLQ